MKKYFIKYTFEFLVIVMGISVSFWLNNYKSSLENSAKEIEVYQDLLIGIVSLDNVIENRTSRFKFDLDIVENLLGLSDFKAYNYDDLMIAVTDWRGFNPNQEIYSTLKEEGSLSYIKLKEIKVMLEEFYHSSKESIVSNMADDIMVQREILKYLNYNYPTLVLSRQQNDDTMNLLNFKKVIDRDLTLKSLIKAKHRFMLNKYNGILKYAKVQEEVKALIRSELEKRL